MKKTAILILLALLTFTPMAWAWNGTGTEADPYQISSTADWNTLATNVNNGSQTYSGKYFILMADITVTETISSGTPATMVGTSDSNSFRGTFDGNGNKVARYQSKHNLINNDYTYNYDDNGFLTSIVAENDSTFYNYIEQTLE